MTLADVFHAWTQPAVLLLTGFALLSVLLWRLPFIGLLFYPFRLFNTFVHELSHGVAAVATGGEFLRFVIHPNGGGKAQVRGGSTFVMASAGYLGAALFGAAVLFLVASALADRTLLVLLGCSVCILTLVFVRNVFGFVAGLLLACMLVAAGFYLRERYVTALLMLLAIQTSLSALDSLVVLMRVSLHPRGAELQSDAQILAQDTGIPAIIWALLWCLISIAMIVVAVTLAYRAGALS